MTPVTDDTPISASRELVLIVAPQPFYEDRGTPIAIRQVITGLTNIGYGVEILTYPIGKDIASANTRILRCANPFRIRSVPIGFSIRKVVLDVALTTELVRRLRRHRYVVIHAVEEMGFPAVFLAHRRNIRVIYDMQSSLPSQLRAHAAFRPALVQRVLRRLEKWLINRADLVACSMGLIDYVRSVNSSARVMQWGFVGEPVAGDAEAAARIRRDLGIADEQPVVMYTGNFHAYQGLSLLTKAIPDIVRAVPNTVVVLVGATDSDRIGLPNHVASLIDERKLRIVSRQPRERISEYLEIADVLVSPRIQGDNIPLKIFTYMAAHRPIVATDIAAHRSLLDEGRGVLVDPTASALAKGVLSLLRRPENAAAVANRARDYMMTHHNDDAFTDLLRKLYLRGTSLGRRGRGNLASHSASSVPEASAENKGKAEKSVRFETVSVIIPARNEQSLIADVVNAVREQQFSGQSLEVIVVDDGSTDATVANARTAGARVIDAGGTNAAGNPAAARNLGAQQSKGDPIIFLDADCVVAEGWLEALLEAHANGSIVVGGALALPPGLEAMARCDYYCGWYLVHPRAPAGIVPHHPPPNLSVRRQAFLGTSGFTTQPPLDYTNEERFWQAELRNAGHEIYFEPQAVAYHYNRPGFLNLLRRNYRWGYTAIEAKSQTGTARIAWLYRRPWLLIPAAPVLVIAHTAYIIGCWARAGIWEPVLMLPAVLASRLTYVSGMVVGALRWIWGHGAGDTKVRHRPRWR
ncbi:MAG: glycosyltransferase [Proteobacteria bacterium]|nr:glycosyltransferase [Pseudomonadota bacterium]